MKIRSVINQSELKKLREWKIKITEAKKKKNHHPFQYYSPFVKIDDVNSISRRHLIYCKTQKRCIHLLSDGEARAYHCLLHQEDVIGIREQFPLHLPTTIRIANDMRVLHPRNWKTKEVYVMSTDFLVDRVNFETGAIFQEARNYKYWDQIYEYSESGVVVKKRWRTWQKAAIEEMFWASKSIPTIQMTDRDATKIAAQNITWFRMRQELDVDENDLSVFKRAFLNSYLSNSRVWLEEHLFHISKVMGLTFKDVQAMFQFAAYHHEIDLNIELPIRLAEPLVVHV
jgi:hypothetical protein